MQPAIFSINKTLLIVKYSFFINGCVFSYKTGDIQSDDIDHVRWFLAINNEKAYVDDRIYITRF